MSHACQRRCLAATLLLIVASGCIVPSSEDILGGLSKAILIPKRTCEQLRTAFGAEYLPLVDYPDELGLTYEEHFVPTASGQTVRTWFVPATESRGVVVVSPGAAGTLPCYLYITLLLNADGWSTVSYEYEGFGQSSGRPDLAALYSDLEAVLDWTLARTGLEEVTLYGVSLGSIPTVAIAVDRPEAVNGVVLDSPVAFERELMRFNDLLGGFVPLVVDALDPELLSDKMIARMRQPLLVFMEENDTVTPPATVEHMYNLAPGPKMLVSFPGLDHARGLFQRTQEYMGYMEQFLTATWTRTIALDP